MPVIPTDSAPLHVTTVYERPRGWFAEVLLAGVVVHETADFPGEIEARRAGQAWAEARR